MSGLGDFNQWLMVLRNFADETIARAQSVDFLVQLAAIFLSCLLALWFASFLRRLASGFSQSLPPNHPLASLIASTVSISMPGLWLVLLWFAANAGRGTGLSMTLADICVSLLTAWVVIRIFSHVVRNPIWSGVIFFAAWTLAALNILGVLDIIEASLDRLAFPYGTTRISALNVVTALFVLIVLLWLTAQLRLFLERRIFQASSLTPSLQALLVQLLKLGLPVVAVMAALPVLGLNLTALTVFGGALAVGAGLGLQRAVANLVSGLMLLSGGSVRPGDVIALKDMSGIKTFGRVNSIGARYVSLRTRDGIDHLIPNDNFLSNGVENWSHTDNNVRLQLNFGTAYECDPNRVIALSQEAVAKVSRVLKSPPPVCMLANFGESSINFDLRFWIEDPMNGVVNVKSECLLRLWEQFQANGIRMPYATRDIRIISVPPAMIGQFQDSHGSVSSPPRPA